jgi:hypothetical protein
MHLELQTKDDPTCPPAGWDTCGGAWPPNSWDYCCSEYGNLGTSDAHCEYSNALDECCTLDGTSLTCIAECEDPPDVCTGDAVIDAILKKSDLGCKIGLTQDNTIYTW